MTKNEVIKILKGAYSLLLQTRVKFEDVRDYKNASEEAIKALEEAHEYRKLGSLKEIKELSEKARNKKAKLTEINNVKFYKCPVCGNILFDYANYCHDCGQKIKVEE